MNKVQSPASNPEQALYPCDLPIKVAGKAVPEFEGTVCDIVTQHCETFDRSNLKRNQSRTGKYQSVTLHVCVDSREHLDAIYKDLSACEHVVWVM